MFDKKPDISDLSKIQNQLEKALLQKNISDFVSEIGKWVNLVIAYFSKPENIHAETFEQPIPIVKNLLIINQTIKKLEPLIKERSITGPDILEKLNATVTQEHDSLEKIMGSILPSERGKFYSDVNDILKQLNSLNVNLSERITKIFSPADFSIFKVSKSDLDKDFKAISQQNTTEEMLQAMYTYLQKLNSKFLKQSDDQGRVINNIFTAVDAAHKELEKGKYARPAENGIVRNLQSTIMQELSKLKKEKQISELRELVSILDERFNSLTRKPK